MRKSCIKYYFIIISNYKDISLIDGLINHVFKGGGGYSKAFLMLFLRPARGGKLLGEGLQIGEP